MRLDEARVMARSLMDGYGLKSWDFSFDRANRRFGCCYRDLSRITLSRPLTLMNGAEEVRRTLLHEIAHALAPQKAGHGPEWKAIARRLGCDTACSYPAEVRVPEGKHIYACETCGYEWKTLRRLKNHRWRRHVSCLKRPGEGRILKRRA